MKTVNRKINTSLRFEPFVYHGLKTISPKGQVSSLVNKIVKNYLIELKRKQLIQAYQRAAADQAVNQEMQVLDGTIEDGLSNY